MHTARSHPSTPTSQRTVRQKKNTQENNSRKEEGTRRRTRATAHETDKEEEKKTCKSLSDVVQFSNQEEDFLEKKMLFYFQ